MNEHISLETKDQKQELDEKYLAGILFLSYKYSQGNAHTQEHIFRYLHHLRPHWKIDGKLASVVTKEATKMAEKYLNGGAKHEDDPEIKGSVSYSVSLEMKALMGVFNDPSYIERGLPNPDTKEVAIATLADDIIKADYGYTVKKKGRPRVNSGSEVTSATDPWLSHVCYYGFLGHSAGLEEYNQMFKDVKEYIIEKEMRIPTQEKLLDVVRIWNQTHPEEQVNL